VEDVDPSPFTFVVTSGSPENLAVCESRKAPFSLTPMAKTKIVEDVN
jgi:hypothetical protein